MIKQITGIINQEKFVPSIPSLMKPWEGKPVTLKLIEKRRSNPQNAYYRGVVIPIIAEELGYTEDEAHETMKGEFLSKPQELIRNDKSMHIMRIASTTQLSTVQFEIYLKKVRDFSGEFLGIFIPKPGEVDLY